MGNSTAATGGDLTGNLVASFTFSSRMHTAIVSASASALGRLFGKWDAADASATDWDFFLDPGDAVKAPHTQTGVSSISLFSAVNQTYNTHFSVRGY